MAGLAVESSAPARVDLAGGTLDLWPLHVLHPGSVTVNLAINLLARCRVRRGERGFHVLIPARGFEARGATPEELLGRPETALVGSLLAALRVPEPLEVDISSEVPFGSGLGGSSALTVALLGALERFSPVSLQGVDRVDLVRDVETRVLNKPAGVQDYFPPLGGGLHRIVFEPGRTRAARSDVDPGLWDRHLTLFDTGASHSSGMNNWEIFKARLEGDTAVARRLEGVRRAAERMAAAAEALDFPAMGRALGEEWDARRELAPVVSTPLIERAIAAAGSAGAWAGKACGAGGGGCVVFLSPAERSEAVRRSLSGLGEGSVLSVRAVNEGLAVRSA
jgi:D-glycero-alpha-D-manno-heptose-7-phosphate kinase